MEKEKIIDRATLGFPVRKDDKVGLGVKARHIGAGLINGFGGGLELHETYEECMAREFAKESGLVAIPDMMKNVGVLYAHHTKEDGSIFVCRVVIYLIYGWTGELVSNTEEMKNNNWYDIKNLPLDNMMPDMPGWLPDLLSGERLIINTRLGLRQKKLLCPVEIRSADDFSED